MEGRIKVHTCPGLGVDAIDEDVKHLAEQHYCKGAGKEGCRGPRVERKIINESIY